MFKLPSPEDSFPTQCAIEIPVRDSTETRKIIVHFRVIASSRWDELARQGAGDLFVEIIADWEHVFAADGKTPLACGAENIRLAADIPYFFAGVIMGYHERFSPLKNFRAPPAG